MYDGCTRNAYHLYMFRYDPEHFDGLPRSRFLEALHAEGIPCSGGYQPLYKEPFLRNTLQSRAFQAIYAPKRISEYLEQIHCPANDRLCETAVWLTQTTLLGRARTWTRSPRPCGKVHEAGGEADSAYGYQVVSGSKHHSSSRSTNDFLSHVTERTACRRPSTGRGWG